MKRLYETVLQEHLSENRQMAFVSGPRQVGKTTLARRLMTGERYLNWDVPEARRTLLAGATSIYSELQLDELSESLPIVVFDEIHKYGKWKSLLKGFFDLYEERCRCIVTGSSRLDTYRRGGDSLLGRYFLYRIHPFSVAELEHGDFWPSEIRPPTRVSSDVIESLLTYGGFPEPYTKQSARFHRRWSAMRLERLIKEDLRDLSIIQEVGLIQVLAEMITAQTGQLLNYSRLARDLTVSVDTVTRWIRLLESLYFCYTIKPWFKNVNKSLRKQPKIYLWDWSTLPSGGAQLENMVASHLLKAVHAWSDYGLGKYELRFLRDTAGREVDFVVIRNGSPWFLVEVKTSARRGVNPNLAYFQNSIGTEHAFQVCFDMDYVDRDCFSVCDPVRVPISTLLSQLV